MALDTTALARPGAGRGIGRYVRTLVEALDQNDVPVQKFSLGAATSSRWQEWVDIPRRHRLLRKIDPRVYHSPTVFSTPVGHDLSRTVASVLDVIPLEVAGYTRSGIKTRFFFRQASRAACILTLSQHSASRISTLLQVDRNRIVVAPLPLNPAFRGAPAAAEIDAFVATQGLTRLGYLVAVGDFTTPDPRKRLGWLPDIASAVQRATGMPLAVAGDGSAQALTGVPGIRGLGRLDDRALACLLAGASVFVYTTAYEGQGLPAMEAIGVGTPVVGMHNSSIPEVVGEAGVLLEEGEAGPERLARACITLAEQPAELAALRRRASERAGQFDHASFGRQVMSAYRRVGGADAA